MTTLRTRTAQAYARVAGDKTAAAVFAAPSGAIVGPIQSDFGWVVVKVDAVKSEGGKSLDQARPKSPPSSTPTSARTRSRTSSTRSRTRVDDGSNFAEAAAAAKLTVTTHAADRSPTARRAPTPAYKPPPELAPALKTGFEIAPNDPPEIVALRRRGLCGGLARPRWSRPRRRRSRAFATGSRTTGSATRRTSAQAAAADRRSRPRRAGARSPRRSRQPAFRCRRCGRSPRAGSRSPMRKARSRRRCELLFTVAQGKAGWWPSPTGRGFFVVKVEQDHARQCDECSRR